MTPEGGVQTKKRHISRTFTFNVNGKDVRVCKSSFLATLDVGDKYVEHALQQDQQGTYSSGETEDNIHPIIKL